MQNIFSLDWTILIVPGRCLASDFSDRLLLTALGPFIPLSMILLFLYLKSINKSLQSSHFTWRSLLYAFGNGLLSTIPFVLLTTFIFVPSVSAKIFRVWSCEAIGFSKTEDHFYLRDDFAVRCYTSAEHAYLRSIAYPLIGLWPVGVLILWSSLLLSARKSILRRTPTRLTHSIAFLHRDTQPDFYYWEIVELVRRTTLSTSAGTRTALLHLPMIDRYSHHAQPGGFYSSTSRSPSFVSLLR